jgi:hypothetical protein
MSARVPICRDGGADINNPTGNASVKVGTNSNNLNPGNGNHNGSGNKFNNGNSSNGKSNNAGAPLSHAQLEQQRKQVSQVNTQAGCYFPDSSRDGLLSLNSVTARLLSTALVIQRSEWAILLEDLDLDSKSEIQCSHLGDGSGTYFTM